MSSTSAEGPPPARRYFIRTFGCQMNEHDSERVAGVLEADGLVAAAGVEDADVVVLNTCCIRENADNKLYGHLGHLKALKDRRPEVQIAVGGCLAQKDRQVIRQRAPWVDAVWGTHNVGRAADLLHTAGTLGPVTEILEEAQAEADAFPSALPVRRQLGWAAWVTIQVGCDNHCAFCIVPAVRGPEISRPFGQIVDEVTQLAADGTQEVTLLGQNVNSYGRDLTLALRGDSGWRDHGELTGEAWAGAGAPRARPLFADLLRAVAQVEGIRRVRYTSPHPKDLRPETVAAMAEEPAVCEHLHLPLQSGSDRVLGLMHRGYRADRYLEKLAMARRVVPDLAVTTDIIVGFPGETEADFERTLEVVAAAEYDSAYQFVFSPRPGTRSGGTPSRLRARRRGRGALRAAQGGRRAQRPPSPPGARRPPGRGAGGRAFQEGPGHGHRPHPPGQARPFPGAGRGARARRIRGRGHRHPGRPPLPHRRAGRGGRRPPAPHAYPGGRPLIRHLALVGCTASGKSAVALEVARRLQRRPNDHGGPPVELVSMDSMQVYRGMDIGTAKPTAAQRAEVAHHLIDVVDPDEPWDMTRHAAAVECAVAGIEQRGHRALLVGGTGLYVHAVTDGFRPPGRWPDVAAALDAEPDTAALHRRLQEVDPLAASRMQPSNRRRVLRALEVTLGSGRPFSSFGPGVARFAPTRWRLAGLWLPRAVVGERIAARFAAMLDAGLLDEVRRLAAGRGLARTARQALGYRELLDHLEQGTPLAAAVDRAVARSRAFARRQRMWWRRDPRIRWYGAADNPLAVVPALLGDWSAP